MTVLALDTSSDASSAALVFDDGRIIADTVIDGRRHAEELAPLLARMSDPLPPLELIAVGVGPGPYTGLRVGIATGNALGLALGVPVVGICSLDVIAFEHAPDDTAIVTSDARRGEVYWARYEAGTRVDGPHVHRLTDVEASNPDMKVWISGVRPSATALARLAVRWSAESIAVVDPSVLAQHGEDDGSTARMLAGATLLEPRPLYVRRADAVAQTP
jgi:tRNA threonylcarbamoyl adenosine modification protein YeaZ